MADTMHSAVLESCAAFLRCDEGEVLELRDNADLLAALLAGIGLELRVKNASNGTQDHTRTFCNAVLTGWGETPFTARQLLDWCEGGLSREQRAALAACRALCRMPGTSDGDLSAVQLGVAFKRAASDTENEALRLEPAGASKGVTRWQVRGLRG